MRLSMVSPGTRVNVLRIWGGREVCVRLASLGVVPGAEVEVVRGGAGGPLVISILDSRLMLGRGVAHKVEVAL